MALARTSNQLLRSQGNDTTTVAANYPITGDGSTQLPLGLDENYHGADGESLTFNITDIENGHQVTISGIQGSSSFNVLNGQDGANGVNGLNGADGQSVTFDITNIASGHRVTLSGAQGSASFDVLNGQNGVDGVSPTFRFVENDDGVTIIVSGAQGEDSFTLFNASGEGSTYSAGSFIDIYDVEGQKYISANVSAGTPWISGWKDIGTLSLNFGDSVQIVSSHDFSGFHNHSIGLKGAVVTLPSTAHIGSALDNKLDTSSFSNFINTEYSTAKSDIYNSASYLMQNKLDTSASGNFYPMTGNPSGFLTAVDLSNYYTKNETSSRAEISAAIDAIPVAVDYSAGANINITNHVVSGKDWTNTITAASAYAASQAQGKTYTGVAPIVVNNNEDKISADCIELSAGNGIDSNLLAIGTIAVSGAGNYDDIFTYQVSTPAGGYTIHSGLELRNYQQQGVVYKRFYISGSPMGDIVPTAYEPNQYLTTNAQGVLQWENKQDLMTDYTVLMNAASISAVDLSSYDSYKQVTLVTPYLYDYEGGLTAYGLYVNGTKKLDLQSACYYTFVKQLQYNDTTAWKVACSGNTIWIA
mgnify:CR=1 FL=1